MDSNLIALLVICVTVFLVIGVPGMLFMYLIHKSDTAEREQMSKLLKGDRESLKSYEKKVS